MHHKHQQYIIKAVKLIYIKALNAIFKKINATKNFNEDATAATPKRQLLVQKHTTQLQRIDH